MTAHILSQHGNVISADFRPRPFDASAIQIDIKTELLYCDHLVCLMRFHLSFAGKVIATEHITVATS